MSETTTGQETAVAPGAMAAAVSALKEALPVAAYRYGRPERYAEIALTAANAWAVAEDEAYAKRMLAETMFDGMDVGPDVLIRLRMAAELSASMVAAFKTMLDTAGAENYLEQSIIDRETGDRYLVTVLRPNGKTPHELRRAAEAEEAMRPVIEALLPLIAASKASTAPITPAYRAVIDAADRYLAGQAAPSAIDTTQEETTTHV